MLKVIIAEDELMIADILESTLVANGYEVCGIARTVDEAVALVELHEPDLAVFDVRLAGGGRSPEVVRRLAGRRKLEVLYATGSDPRYSALTAEDGAAAIAKPYHTEDVVKGLKLVWEIANAGTISQPFPAGFRLLPKSVPMPARAFQA